MDTPRAGSVASEASTLMAGGIRVKGSPMERTRIIERTRTVDHHAADVDRVPTGSIPCVCGTQACTRREPEG